jgi:hypothetical protein
VSPRYTPCGGNFGVAGRLRQVADALGCPDDLVGRVDLSRKRGFLFGVLGKLLRGFLLKEIELVVLELQARDLGLLEGKPPSLSRELFRVPRVGDGVGEFRLQNRSDVVGLVTIILVGTKIGFNLCDGSGGQ